MQRSSKFAPIVWTLSMACLLGCLAYFFLRHRSLPAEQPTDPLLISVFVTAGKTNKYAEHAETEDTSTGNLLHISGDYLVNDTDHQFASNSTTTLTRRGNPPVIFLMATVVTDSNIYVRLTNETPAFRLSVPATGVWQHFRASAIPSAYANIVVAGPLVDDLQLFRNNGAFLATVKTAEPARIGNQSFSHYIFKLSRLAEARPSPEIARIAELLGASGTIDAWIDASSTSVAYLRLTNGSTYTATSTFSRQNEPLGITAPTAGN